MTDLEPIPTTGPLTPTDGNFLYKLSGQLCNTDFVPKPLRGNAPACFACILSGREMGLGPLESLQQIAVIDGRPALSAQLMRKLILRLGHHLQIELGIERCTIHGTRSDNGDELTVVWTTEDATRAGLVGTYEAWETREDGRRHKLTWSPTWGGEKPDWVERKGKLLVKDSWQKYPRAMLFARATSELARALFPDVLGAGRYTPDELGQPLAAADVEAAAE